jgi:hypothetical protein
VRAKPAQGGVAVEFLTLEQQHGRAMAARERMLAAGAALPPTRRKKVATICRDVSAEWGQHLRDEMLEPLDKPAPQQLIKVAAKVHCVPVDEIRGNRRLAHVVRARHLAVRLIARAYPAQSTGWIGKLVNMDQSTVRYILGLTTKARRLGYPATRLPYTQSVGLIYRAAYLWSKGMDTAAIAAALNRRPSLPVIKEADIARHIDGIRAAARELG